MNNIVKIISLVVLLTITGGGCMSFSSSGSTSADGALWRTEDSASNWTQLDKLPQASGVVSIGGVNVTDLEIDPVDPKTYYLGTFTNGLFYSYNSGNTWERTPDDKLRTGAVLKIDVDPNDKCTIYALTPSDVVKSVDCARSFDSIYKIDQSDETLTAMVVDWYSSNRILVGDTLGTLLKTDDHGETWSTIQRFGREVTDISISNHDSRIILVGTQSNGLYRSVDAGVTWVEYESPLKKEFKDSDKVYGFTQTADGTSVIMNTKYGLLRSEDYGESWTAIPLITEPRDVRIWAVAYDPESSLNIYYATSTTFYSTSTAGDSWVTNDVPSSRTPMKIVIHPKDGGVVYAGFAALEE